MSYLPLLKFLTPSLRLFLARSLLTNPQPLRLPIKITTPASTTNARILLVLFKIAPPFCCWLRWFRDPAPVRRPDPSPPSAFNFHAFQLIASNRSEVLSWLRRRPSPRLSRPRYRRKALPWV